MAGREARVSEDPQDSVVGAAVRAADPDRYFAGLFAAAERRDALFTLYAFHLEIAKVREVVSEPMLGQIRLQWWRDALDGIAEKRVRAHPVVEALAPLLQSGQLLATDLHAMIDAREADLEEVPFEDDAGLQAYADGTAGAVMLAGARLLAGASLDGPARAGVIEAGRAWALTGLMRALPFHAARRHCTVPKGRLVEADVDPESIFAGRATPALLSLLSVLRDQARAHLEAGRAQAGAVPEDARPAVLYAGLARRYLARMDGPAYDPFRTDTSLGSLTRLPRLLWMHWRGRF